MKKFIPEGPYCYKIIKIENTSIEVKCCDYYKKMKDESYCELLDVSGDILLDDQVKICGINEKGDK